MDKSHQDELLSNWLELNKTLMILEEEEILALMEREKSQRARLRVMMRLYHRFSRLRSQREKREMGANAKA